MSDFSYFCAYWAINPIFWLSSRPIVLHAQRAARPGGFILVPNHLSPFEVPLAVRHSPRHLDFMSIVEMLRNPIARSFFGLWNTFYLDRGKSDHGAMREALRRLKNGRVVAMFPEGRIRTWEESVLNGGAIKLGVARLAEMANVPVIPCVVLDGEKYLRAANWIPIRRTRYGIIFGHPMKPRTDLPKTEARQRFLEDLCQAYRDLRAELEFEMEQRGIARKKSPAILSPGH